MKPINLYYEFCLRSLVVPDWRLLTCYAITTSETKSKFAMVAASLLATIRIIYALELSKDLHSRTDYSRERKERERVYVSHRYVDLQIQNHGVARSFYYIKSCSRT